MVALIETVLALVGLVVLARWVERSWLSPGAFYALVWAGYALLGTQFGLDSGALTVGLLWVVLSCMLVHGGCVLGRTREFINSGRTSAVLIKAAGYPYLKLLTVISTAVGLLEIGYVLFSSSSTIADALTYAYINQLVMANRSTFVYGPENQGFLERIAFAVTYTAPLFGGVLFSSDTSLKVKAIGLASGFVPSIVGLLYGSRMGALYGGSFWVASYMASRVFSQTSHQSSNIWSVLKVLMGATALIVGMSGVVTVIRYDDTMFTSVETFFETAGDIFIFFPVFALWLHESPFIFSHLTFGNLTFGRMFELFDLHTAENYFYRVEYYAGGTSSNYFTIYRGLIDDFGHIGASVAILTFGIFAGISYKRVVEKQIHFIPMLTIAYAGIFTSLSFSLFTYVTPTIALVLFSIYFGLVGQKQRSGHAFNIPCSRSTEKKRVT